MDQIQRNRAELVIALRSGKLKQCYTTLFMGEEACFAGQAMRLFGIAQSQEDIKDKWNERPFWVAVHKNLGMDVPNHGVPFSKFPLWPLVAMNDKGQSFAEIADALVDVYNFPEALEDVKLEEEVLEHTR